MVGGARPVLSLLLAASGNMGAGAGLEEEKFFSE